MTSIETYVEKVLLLNSVIAVHTPSNTMWSLFDMK